MFPDMLGIGAQRSGSTWLYNNLNAHPEIWLTPVKELHYFDGKGVGIPQGVWRKFISRQWPHMRCRRVFLSRMKAKTRAHPLSDWAWDYRYFFKPQDDQWYASLFDQGAGKCTGEITPAYALLDDREIADIHKLMPDTKILFLMRNPVDRSWSQAVKEFSKHKNRSLDSVEDGEWEETFSHQRVTLRSDYLLTLEKWGRHYPQDQIFVGFFDHVLERPRELLLDIYRFLGVGATGELLPMHPEIAVNPGRKMSIPPRWEQYLSRQYIKQISAINDRYSGPASNWLARAQAML